MSETILQTVMMAAQKNRADLGDRWLVQVHPLDLEQNRVALDQSETTLGRSEHCSVVLEDESVSRLHARILSGENGYSIEDLGSTNGVLVNDELIESCPLRTGDRIQLGSRIFRFLADTDVEAQYHETVYSMMTRDGLTSVFNKRYLLECLDREVARGRKHQRRVAVLLMDIDHFKSINDEYGHLVGDEVLRELALRLSRILEDDQVFARFGGEEFAILDGEADMEAARELGESCRLEIASQPFDTSDGPIEVTISIGVAIPDADSMTDRDSLLSLADQRLYEAKRQGRNRVVSE
ncbi:MAG: diguanylate cyclase [Aureliella sp.]